MTLEELGVLPGIHLPFSADIQVALFLVGYVAFLALVLYIGFRWDKPGRKKRETPPHTIEAYLRFAWGCFIKPHSGDRTGNQQDALESFYKQQASVYDATRAKLLHGRDDMLGLVAAQLQHKASAGLLPRKPIWIDVSTLLSSMREVLRSASQIIYGLEALPPPRAWTLRLRSTQLRSEPKAAPVRRISGGLTMLTRRVGWRRYRLEH